MDQTTYVEEVWRWLLKNCDLYCVLHKQTDKQMKNALGEVRTCQNWHSGKDLWPVQQICWTHGPVHACDQEWWWLAQSFLRFCEIPIQPNRQTNEKAIVLAKISNMVITLVLMIMMSLWAYSEIKYCSFDSGDIDSLIKILVTLTCILYSIV